MRVSILLWSTASGIILGLLADAMLVGVAVLVSSMLPGRLPHRWVVILAGIALTAIPIVLAILGFLEGQLKAT